MYYKFGVFAYGDVGLAAVRIFRDRKKQLKLVLLDRGNFWEKNDLILEELKNYPQTEILYYENEKDLISKCMKLDMVILAWWGKLIKDELLGAPRHGFINLHTSFLPYGKGKHPHYWSIVEEKPYGVTIMKIDAGLDTGGIIYQKEVEKGWEDTGKSLYFKGIRTMCDLLESKRENILNLDFQEKPQIGEGTFHYGKEIEEDSQINLEEKYRARDLLNKIRARTFEPFPAAYFIEDGETYEVRVSIRKVEESFDSKKINYSEIKENT